MSRPQRLHANRRARSPGRQPAPRAERRDWPPSEEELHRQLDERDAAIVAADPWLRPALDWRRIEALGEAFRRPYHALDDDFWPADDREEEKLSGDGATRCRLQQPRRGARHRVPRSRRRAGRQRRGAVLRCRRRAQGGAGVARFDGGVQRPEAPPSLLPAVARTQAAGVRAGSGVAGDVAPRRRGEARHLRQPQRRGLFRAGSAGLHQDLLAGFAWQNGGYRELALETMPDGMRGVYSQALGLYLCRDEPWPADGWDESTRWGVCAGTTRRGANTSTRRRKRPAAPTPKLNGRLPRSPPARRHKHTTPRLKRASEN